MIFLNQPGQVQEEKNITLHCQHFIKRGNLGQKNIEESKTLNDITMKPRKIKTLNFGKSLLTCCAASKVCKQSCSRPLKSLQNQEALSPKFLKKLKKRSYSYCVISRYFTLRHLRRLLTPFMTKSYFRATAFLQKRPEVTSDFKLGVVGRENKSKC